MKDIKNDKIILKSFIGCILAILVLSLIFYILYLIFAFKTIEHSEVYISNGEAKTFPWNYNILCENGLEVIQFPIIDGKHILGCSRIIYEGRLIKCSGEGKMCIIKWKERVKR